MKKWRVDWSTYDLGDEVVEAETEEEAYWKFREIPIEKILPLRPCNNVEIVSIKEARE